MVNQLFNRPNMVGQVSSHSWSCAEAEMYMTEVVHAPSPEQPHLQVSTQPRRGSCAPHQRWQPCPQGGIEPLHIGGVHYPYHHLRGLYDAMSTHHAPIGQSSLDLYQSLAPSHAGVTLDYLYDVQVTPHHQAR